jgi:hypothetical protein
MDSVGIALLLTLPIVAVGLILHLWIRRSGVKAVANRRRTISILLIIAVICILSVTTSDLGAESKLRRYITGTSAVEIRNASGGELQDLEWTLRYSNGETNSEAGQTMPPLSRRAFSASGPLSLDSLRGRAGTNRFSFAGKVNKRERLVIHIGPGGQITPKLD